MAQILNKMNIDDVVTFDVYPSDLLGTKYHHCKVKAILDYDSVRQAGVDPDALHVKVFASLPVGTPNDPQAYQWLKIQLVSGEYDYIGIPWVKADTIVVNTTTTVTVTYRNVSPNDVQKIRVMSANNGYTDFDIKVE